ncbi:MAG: urease accessory protein UreD [Burkholderiales bacterium]|nr:urease accessory protein UreD [Burkholderiales bacterium]
MIPREPAIETAPGWQARLHLRYAYRDGKTVLIERNHIGPLRVQKALYPEGGSICHTMVLHPPGGIAGGDQLEIGVDAQPASQALLTTPGATRWYKSGGIESNEYQSEGAAAAQHVHLAIGNAAMLEWFPQENIVFNAANAELSTVIELAGNAQYLGWDILCLGRAASGERFTAGCVRQRVELWRNQRRLWLEYGTLRADDDILSSIAGLQGATVTATLIAASQHIDKGLLARCREVATPGVGQTGLTALPQLLLARYLGHSAEAAKHYFIALWSVLRPALTGVPVCAPRIWRT